LNTALRDLSTWAHIATTLRLSEKALAIMAIAIVFLRKDILRIG